MSLQLILGKAGSGKTHYLYERVIKEAMDNPKRNYIVIVPEQFTMATQKELVKRHPNGGILNIDVLSFGRLAHRIFEEVGRDYDGILDDEGKSLILRKIAGDYEDKLKVVGKNIKKLGYISEVKSVISEFTQYKIGEERIAQLKETVPANSMLAYKLDDIGIIYKGFYDYLGEKYIAGEELLSKLSKAVGTSTILQDSVVTFDGFTGFTPLQEELIGELLKVCSGVYMTITMDAQDDFYGSMTGQDLFALSRETLDNMNRIASENGIACEKPVLLGEEISRRFRNNEALAFLEKELFRYSGNKFIESQAAVSAHVLRNPEEEARWVASEIKRLVRVEGYRYQDIAIIASSTQDYATPLKRACEKYNVPVFSDQKRSILLNSFVEYIRSALLMIEKNYTYETVFRFLKSGFAPMSMKRVDALETYVLSRGITGYKKWQAPWALDSERMSEKQLEYLNASRVKFVERVQKLQGILTQSSKSVEDICIALYEFFVESKIQSRLSFLEEELKEEGRMALAKEYSQIYEEVLKLLDKFVLLLGDEKVSLKEFNELLDAGLQEVRIGVIPPSMDAVIIGDITRTRVEHIKALFFVGNNDAYLPGNMNASGLLSERDREVLSEYSVRLKPSSKAQLYIQKFYLYLMCTKPSEKLYISLSKTSSQGKSVRPSYFMGELRKLFPKLKVVEEEMKLEQVELTPEIGLQYLIEGLRSKDMREEPLWQELYLWYTKHPEWEEQVTAIVNGNQYKKSGDKLTKEIAEQLYGDVLKNSVTRLEKFATCPYAHFLSYGLGLREREIHEFEAVDLGNVFHTAMELYSEKVKAQKKDWVNVDLVEQAEWAEEAVDKSVNGYGYDLLFKSERDKYNIERIKRMMKRSVWAVSEQLACGEFKPEGFEVAFGEGDTLSSSNITLSNNHTMCLRGKIDRVDLRRETDATYVKIVDYKTGSKELSLSELYYGLQLQLFVYLNAAVEIQKSVEIDKRVIPAGVLYYRMNDPIVPIKEGQIFVESDILVELTPDGLVNSSAKVIDKLDKNLQGKSYAIPVAKDKDGNLKPTSKAVSEKEFETIEKFTKTKVKELGQEVIDGVITISPYKDEKRTGCDYCVFNKICGFDSKIPGYEYRKIKTSKAEEAMQLIDAAVNGTKGDEKDGSAVDEGTATSN